MSRVRWRSVLRRAVQLGLLPPDLWKLSLAEWRALNTAPESTATKRADLRALIAAFPDTGTSEGHPHE